MINYDTDAVRRFSEQVARGTPSITTRSKDDIYTGEPQRAKKPTKATKATSTVVATQFAQDGTITVSHTATTISQVETTTDHLANFVAPAVLNVLPQLAAKNANTTPRLPAVAQIQAQPIEMRTFKGISDTIGVAKTVTLATLFEKLKNPIVTSETMEEYERLPKAEQAKLKDNGLYLLGVTDGNGKREENLLHRTAGAIDIDAFTDDTTEEKFQHALQGVEFIYHTTRKSRRDAPRYRIIVPFSATVTAQEYKKVMQYLLNHLQSYGVTADECSLKATQCMYFPTISIDQQLHYNKRIAHVVTLADPDTFTEHRHGLLDVATILQFFTPPPKKVAPLPLKAQKSVPPRERNGLEGAFNRAYDPHEAIKTFLPHVYEFEPRGERYRHRDSTSGVAGLVVNADETIHSYGGSDPFKTGSAYQLVLLHKFHGDAHAMQLYCNTDERIATEQKREFEEGEEWKAQLIRTEAGKVKNEGVNLALIAEHDKRYRDSVKFNIRSGFTEVSGALPWSRDHMDKYWGDYDTVKLSTDLGKTYGISAKAGAEEFIYHLQEFTAYEPLQEYMKVAGDAWDGVPRVRNLFIDLLGAEDNDNIRAFTELFFRGGVARTFNAGCKFDEMIVLVGGQGIGKSMLLQKLATQQEFFNDSLTTFTGDESYMQIRNALIVEIAELSALRKSEDAEAKKFISSTHDTYRTKFEKHATPKPRRCIFAGTTNNTEFLRDQTGGRRFLPIVCYGSAPEKVANLSPEEVQQLWGEAYHLYKKNPALVLPKEARAHAKLLQEEHTADPFGVEEFAVWLKTWCGNFISKEIIRKEFLDIKNVSDISEGNKRLVDNCYKYVEHTLYWKPHRKNRGRGLARP